MSGVGRRAARLRARGVSLVELIIVVVVIGVGMPPLMMSLADGQRTRAAPVLADTAHWLAVERLEEVLADRFSAERGLMYIDAVNYPDEKPVPGFDAFTRTVRIEGRGPGLAPGGEGYTLVTVDVIWTDPASGERTLSVSTAFAELAP